MLPEGQGGDKDFAEKNFMSKLPVFDAFISKFADPGGRKRDRKLSCYPSVFALVAVLEFCEIGVSC